jgi:hypothetical protein
MENMVQADSPAVLYQLKFLVKYIISENIVNRPMLPMSKA